MHKCDNHTDNDDGNDADNDNGDDDESEWNYDNSDNRVAKTTDTPSNKRKGIVIPTNVTDWITCTSVLKRKFFLMMMMMMTMMTTTTTMITILIITCL